MFAVCLETLLPGFDVTAVFFLPFRGVNAAVSLPSSQAAALPLQGLLWLGSGSSDSRECFAEWT